MPSIKLPRDTIGVPPSLLSRKALDRLLAQAPPSSERTRGNLRSELNILVDAALLDSFYDRVRKKHLQTLRMDLLHTRELVASLQHLRQAGVRIPLPRTWEPEPWLDAIERWLEAEEEGAAKGRPIDNFTGPTYRSLIGLFERLKGAPAGTTLEGPLARFIIAFHKAMLTAANAAEFDSEEQAQRVRAIWEVPNAEKLRARIRTAFRVIKSQRASSPMQSQGHVRL